MRGAIRKLLEMGLLVLVVSLSSCQGCPPIKTIPFNLSVSGVTTQILMVGQVDTVNSCDPATPPAPQDDQPDPSKSDEVIAGFDHWRNTLDNCQESKVLVYRGLVQFDLTPLVQANKQNLLNSAYLEFDTTNSWEVPQISGRIPNCAAQLQYVLDPWTAGPPSRVRSFPRGGPLGGQYTLPNQEFPLPPLPQGVQLTPQGHFKIDVMTYVQRWIVGNQPNNGFMFSSVDESTPLPVPSNSACHTHFANFKLTVNTL